MTIYLVVEYQDHGPGYGLGRIIKGFSIKEKAELLRDQLNEEDKQICDVDGNGMSYGLTYFPPFRVEDVDFE